MRELLAVLSIITVSIFSITENKYETEKELIPVYVIEFQPWELVLDVAWAPDGNLLAVSSGNFVRLFSAPDFELVNSVEISALTHTLSFDKKSEYLAAGSRDGYLRIWRISDFYQPDIETIQPVAKINAHRHGVNQLVFDSEGKRLASGGNDAVARLWDFATHEIIRTMIGGTLTVPAVAFRPGGEILAVSNGNVIRMRDIENEGIVGSFRSEHPIFCLQFDREGKVIAAGDLANQVLLWDPDSAFRTGVEKYPEPAVLAGHNGRPNSFESIIWDIDFSPTGKLLASGGGDGNLVLWDVDKREAIAHFHIHDYGVTGVDFDPSGSQLVTGGLDARVKVWKLGESILFNQ